LQVAQPTRTETRGTAALPSQADVVVIGGGMGGLTSAALLAKAGLDVCVIEMDARPGGYLAGYERQHFIFDTAIHWLNQCGPGGTVRRMLDFVGPGAPETPPLRAIRRYRGDSFDYLLTDEPDVLRDQLMADFPDEAQGIRRFFAASRRIGAIFSQLSRKTRAPATMTVLEKIACGLDVVRLGFTFVPWSRLDTVKAMRTKFRSPALERIFCSEVNVLSCLTPVGWAYHGDYQAPPAGGGREFPRFLVRAIEAFGSRVVFRTRVERIVLDGKRVAGVEVLRGRSSPERHTIRCKYVLAACDLQTVYERMLPHGAIPARRLAKSKGAEIYDSAVSISLALDKPSQELGFGEELILLSRDDVSRTDHNNGNPAEAAISILAPSLRDPSMAPAGKGTLTFLTMANIAYGDHWKTGPGLERGPEYDAFKQAYADVIIDRVAAAFCPGLRAHIERCDVATPVTHWRYTGNRSGSIMASKANFRNIRNNVAHYVTPVTNLFLAGQWAEYGGGVPGATRAGTNSALLVMQRERPRAFEILRDVLDGRRDPKDQDAAVFQTLA
jgi:prolycopene isomerase